MNIKIEFLDKEIGAVRMYGKISGKSYFQRCYPKHFNEDYELEFGHHGIKIENKSEVWELLTEYALGTPDIEDFGSHLKDFYRKTMSELSRFVEENREVFY